MLNYSTFYILYVEFYNLVTNYFKQKEVTFNFVASF